MDNQKKYTIGIVDDEALFLSGLSMLLNQHDQLSTIVEANNGKVLLEKLENLNGILPDLILCDLEMPVMNGVETVTELNKRYPEIKIVILSGHYESALILKMLEIGASAFVPKDEVPNEFYSTIINVIETGFHYNNHVIQLIREKMLFGVKKKRAELIQLSDREKEVLIKICDQKTNKEIAEELYISVRTVEGHRNNLISKIQAKNTAGIIVYAIEHGLYEVHIRQQNKWL